jgi:hypothetical protein
MRSLTVTVSTVVPGTMRLASPRRHCTGGQTSETSGDYCDLGCSCHVVVLHSSPHHQDESPDQCVTGHLVGNVGP